MYSTLYSNVISNRKADRRTDEVEKLPKEDRALGRVEAREEEIKRENWRYRVGDEGEAVRGKPRAQRSWWSWFIMTTAIIKSLSSRAP